MNRTAWSRKVDAHGRVTIPAELRKQLGLTPGTRVVFWVRRGIIYITSLKLWKKRHRKRP